jgi:hypothetical protein
VIGHPAVAGQEDAVVHDAEPGHGATGRILGHPGRA